MQNSLPETPALSTEFQRFEFNLLDGFLVGWTMPAVIVFLTLEPEFKCTWPRDSPLASIPEAAARRCAACIPESEKRGAFPDQTLTRRGLIAWMQAAIKYHEPAAETARLKIQAILNS